jgi:hypothetical protein
VVNVYANLFKRRTSLPDRLWIRHPSRRGVPTFWYVERIVTIAGATKNRELPRTLTENQFICVGKLRPTFSQKTNFLLKTLIFPPIWVPLGL